MSLSYSEEVSRLPPEQQPFRSIESGDGFDGFMARSGLVREVARTQAMRSLYGDMGPRPEPGYNPYRDQQLRGWENDLHLFRDSQSPEETGFLIRWAEDMRRRSRRWDESAGFVTDLLISNLTPEGIAANLIPMGGIVGATRAMRAMTGAAAFGATNAGFTALEEWQRQNTLPGDIAGNPVEAILFSGLFGAALGGAAGVVSARTLHRLGDLHARETRQRDGQRVVPDPPRTEPRTPPTPPPPVAGLDLGDIPPPRMEPEQFGPPVPPIGTVTGPEPFGPGMGEAPPIGTTLGSGESFGPPVPAAAAAPPEPAAALPVPPAAEPAAAPQASAPASTLSMQSAPSTLQRVASAAFAAGRIGSRIAIADIARALPDVSLQDIHEALLAMARTGDATLSRAEGRELEHHPSWRNAELNVGGDQGLRHTVRFDRDPEMVAMFAERGQVSPDEAARQRAAAERQQFRHQNNPFNQPETDSPAVVALRKRLADLEARSLATSDVRVKEQLAPEIKSIRDQLYSTKASERLSANLTGRSSPTGGPDRVRDVPRSDFVPVVSQESPEAAALRQRKDEVLTELADLREDWNRNGHLWTPEQQKEAKEREAYLRKEVQSIGQQLQHQRSKDQAERLAQQKADIQGVVETPKVDVAALKKQRDALELQKMDAAETLNRAHDDVSEARLDLKDEGAAPGSATHDVLSRRLSDAEKRLQEADNRYTDIEARLAEAEQRLAEAEPPKGSVRLNLPDGRVVDERLRPETFDAVAAEIRRMAGDVLVQAADLDGMWGATLGKVVRIALDIPDGAAMATGRHEVIHLLRQTGRFTEPEWRALEAAAGRKGWLDRYGVNDRWRAVYEAEGISGQRLDEILLEEAIAAHHEQWRQVRVEEDGLVRGVLYKIEQFFERIRNVLAGNGWQTADDVFERIGAGEMAQRAEVMPAVPAAEPVRFNVPVDHHANGIWRRHEAAPEGSAKFETGSLASRIKVGQLPFYRLMNNGFVGSLGDSIARWATDWNQHPGLRTEGNRAGVATGSDSVEANRAQLMTPFIIARQRQMEEYYRYRGWNPKGLDSLSGEIGMRLTETKEKAQDWLAGMLSDPRLPERVRGAVGKATDGQLTFAEWDEAVQKAARGIGHPEAGVMRAAQAWREMYDEFQVRAVRSGVFQSVDTPELRAMSEAYLDGQLQELDALIREEKAKPAYPADSDAYNWQQGKLASLEAEQQTLTARRRDLDGMEPRKHPYGPQDWIRGRIHADRDGLVAAIIRDRNWSRGATWATPAIRAEAAVSAVLTEDAGQRLERVLRRHFLDHGQDPAFAEGQAKDLAKPVRDLISEAMPSRWEVEWASAWARQLDRQEPANLATRVQQVLVLAGFDSESEDLGHLVKAIVRRGGEEAPGDWTDFARTGHAKAREINVDPNLIAPWLDFSMTGAAEYAGRMGTMVAAAEKFGDVTGMGHLNRFTLDAIREVHGGNGSFPDLMTAIGDMKDVRDKVIGTFRIPEDPDAWSIRAMRFLSHAAVVAQMGGTVFSAMTDAGRIVTEHGLRNTFLAMKGVLGVGPDALAWDAGAKEAREAGTAVEMILLGRGYQTASMTRMGLDATLAERWMQGATDTLQFVNLMAPWTQKAQEVAGILAQHRIVELALATQADAITSKEITDLARLGISRDDALRIADNWNLAGGEKIQDTLYLMNSDLWEDRDLVSRVRAAIKTNVDQTVVTPTLADMPNFMAAPAAKMLMLYRAFGMAATTKVMMSGLQRRDAQVAAGALSSLAIAYMVTGPSAGPYDTHPLLSSERLFQAVEKSGLLGSFSDINNALEIVSGNSLGLRPLLGMDPPLYAKEPSWAQRAGQVTGPAIAPWLNAVWALTDGDAAGDRRAAAIIRLLPFQNLLWWSGLWRALGREAGSLIDGE